MTAIDRIEDWLIGQALGSPNLAELFAGLCERLRAVGVPVDRAMLGWPTLHPLIEAETAFWTQGNAVLFEQFAHSDEDGDEWLSSPMRAVLVNRETMLRRRLDLANAEHDFPLCRQLAADGFTDYLILGTPFEMPAVEQHQGFTGIMVSWATRAPGGFSEPAIDAIGYIQKRLALAARATLHGQITRTIAETYLGKWAGRQVLNGQIRHGDGQSIEAVIFFSDMRRSTAIAEDLGPDRYLKLLNRYFDAAAGAVEAEGGEILDFIGDAVLGIFPLDGDGVGPAAVRALAAARACLLRLAGVVTDVGMPVRAGIALSVGTVMFGNIGTANRLTFSVIGQTVHAAARIEALTKELDCTVLMTQEIAAHAPGAARLRGTFRLDGFRQPQPLYDLP
ncbi:adenylate/guanylate cyclase domain-containing protein [Polymorphum gilvum]|nr:adenylate/guanylate cyclase domain-containing protein [Polymorphum gilvum]